MKNYSKLLKDILISSVVMGMLFHSTLIAQQKTGEVYSSVKKKYGSASSLQCNFSSVLGTQTPITGTVKAKKGNKFVLDLGSRVIVCNGETVWNYTKTTNTVVVSNYEDKGQISIEKVFFTYLNAYTSATTFAERTSKGEKYTTLRLLPPSPDKIINGVQSISIALNPKTFAIQRISLTDPSGNQMWKLSSLKTDSKLADSVFEFNPPKEVQVVDMR
ncbi:MAG: outer membrane lipoprotein carrier protein LolA [Ignavibacteriae bacterium]|nr:outer membrane lipoprotein carrier protein LolA [Ignavibacteriota bacterium]